ncbi:ABC-2 type transport system ATP-binding protein [Parafrankia irregularis]|uniref:ABC-2 type transport system ATP-binding protein n=1 Tax=Parafrankia irregularis TaxID=795642 RepID=A0A0S4QRH5_9ACTN|nr:MULTISPECIES: ATP-binding cassette domain-containing protein [Parafrankia]MBE3204393.1 ATP-binding cassette domain-containing protein [Parafrankia sp. CH37]CUU57662.1 ABC-2 type transport system ATP-binding protein [Parafrankia irregularis]
MANRRLEIDGVRKRYGEVTALDGMTFDVRAGELFGFVGSNGAGKTTTMRIVLGVLAADAGEVRWAGRPVDLAVRRRIGYMPEERGLYPKMKVRDQIVYLARLHGMPSGAARRSAEAWLERLGVAARRDDEVQNLSLGNQQRVQLAAALVHDPEVLVLDEPFSGLDPVAVDVMSQVLRERSAAGVPVVFSSHQLELVERLCDRVGIVASGRMVACGTVDELRRAGTEQIVVEVPGAPAGWALDLPGITVRHTEGDRTTVDLAPGADDQDLLRRALAAGPVREFRRRRPTLAELFRSVTTVSAVATVPAAAGGSAGGPGDVPSPAGRTGPAGLAGPAGLTASAGLGSSGNDDVRAADEETAV